MRESAAREEAFSKSGRTAVDARWCGKGKGVIVIRVSADGLDRGRSVEEEATEARWGGCWGSFCL
jgi:hypothetical protein